MGERIPLVEEPRRTTYAYDPLVVDSRPLRRKPADDTPPTNARQPKHEANSPPVLDNVDNPCARHRLPHRLRVSHGARLRRGRFDWHEHVHHYRTHRGEAHGTLTATSVER
jgi:hypothetical protein